jgi:AraC-like DNA-binding protein
MKEIAHSLGFETTDYFFRLFRQKPGSPLPSSGKRTSGEDLRKDNHELKDVLICHQKQACQSNIFFHP